MESLRLFYLAMLAKNLPELSGIEGTITPALGLLKEV
jgi:hypothetical protein